MKKTRRIFALILALAMTLAFGAVAFAATGTITVENATVDKVYNVYKVFDAEYASADVATYTIKDSDEWYDLVKNDTNTPFKVSEPIEGTTDKHSVTLKDGKVNTDVINWFTSDSIKTAAAALTATETKTATATELKFENMDMGYYYISTTNGTAVTLTNAKPDATVIEKNQNPGWGDDGGKFVMDDDGNYITKNTAGIGDTLKYKVVIKNAYNYSGAGKITKYTVDDIEDKGIYIDFHTMKVYVNGTEIKKGWIKGIDTCDAASGGSATATDGHAISNKGKSAGADDTSYEDCNWYVENMIEGDNKFFINIRWQGGTWSSPDGNFLYTKTDGTPNEIVITYDAILKAEATMGNEPNTNTARVSWRATNGGDGGDTNKKAETITYGFSLFKKDGTTGSALGGATFNIKDNAGNVIKLLRSKKDANIYYIYNETTKDDALNNTDTDIIYVDETSIFESFVTPDTGYIVIKGLKGGNYTLTELDAPDGYNVAEPVAVELIEGNLKNEVKSYSVVRVDVANSKGAILPETGGTGKMIFIGVGAVAVIAAGLFLVTNKRISKENF